MKSLALIFFTFLVLVSCESTEQRDPALQAEVDAVFFNAFDSRVTESEDGTYLIQGITQNETLTLKVASLEVDVYQLGGDSENYASFENQNGDTYYTNPNGEVEVVISNWNMEAKTITGSFRFIAMIEGIDTIAVQKGIFFEAPYGFGINDTGGDNGDPSTNAGTFVSYIDGFPFNPFNVTAVESGEDIIITGSTTNRSIVIQVPINIEEGNVVLPASGFILKYQDLNGVQEAISGNLIIFSHTPADNKIKGTFSFQTADKSVSLGQFNVIYE